MTRVLFLCESFHPVLGGGERHLRSLASSLTASGTPSMVLTRRTEEASPAREVLDGIDVLRVGPSGRQATRKFAMVPSAMRALGRERRRYDVIVVRGTRVLGPPALLAARLLGKPVIFQPEVNGELSGEVFTWGKPWAGSAAERLVRGAAAVRNAWLRDADAFVAMSRLIAGECLAAGVEAEKIHLVPHGVDLRRFHPATPQQRQALRSSLGFGDGTWVVYTGRLLRGKGLESLVEAFAAVRSRHPAAGLLLVGSGDAQGLSVEERLHAAVEDADLKAAVRFTGRVDNVEDYLRAADIFAFPSEFEALGLSLIEAAACGLPCIGARTGGIVDVIEHERSGLLVPPRDTAALREAIERLLSDAALRLEYGERAASVASERFDENRALVRYRALFDETARRGRSPGTLARRGSAA